MAFEKAGFMAEGGLVESVRIFVNGTDEADVPTKGGKVNGARYIVRGLSSWWNSISVTVWLTAPICFGNVFGFSGQFS